MIDWLIDWTEYWILNIGYWILDHDCRQVRSHRPRDANQLRCQEICSDSTSGDSRQMSSTQFTITTLMQRDRLVESAMWIVLVPCRAKLRHLLVMNGGLRKMEESRSGLCHYFFMPTRNSLTNRKKIVSQNNVDDVRLKKSWGIKTSALCIFCPAFYWQQLILTTTATH